MSVGQIKTGLGHVWETRDSSFARFFIGTRHFLGVSSDESIMHVHKVLSKYVCNHRVKKLLGNKLLRVQSWLKACNN